MTLLNYWWLYLIAFLMGLIVGFWRWGNMTAYARIAVRAIRWAMPFCDHRWFADGQITAIACIKCGDVWHYEKAICGVFGPEWEHARNVYLSDELAGRNK